MTPDTRKGGPPAQEDRPATTTMTEAQSSGQHNVSASADIVSEALAWHDAGFCVLPTASDGTKRPGVGSWTSYQRQQFPREALAGGRYDGIGLVCGAVSGGLEMLELEGRAIDEGALATITAAAVDRGLAGLLQRVTTDPGAYWERTPSGGVHILYRITDAPVPGNTKLASRPARADELDDNERALVAKGRTVVRVLAETRGEGGYVVVAPSGGPTHPSGQDWRLIAGRTGQVPTITAAEREQLHALFQVIDQAPPRPATAQPAEAAQPRTGTSPGDDFAARVGWAEILEPAGWRVHYTAEGITYWTRPGKETGTSATTNANGTDRLYVHTSSTEFDAQESYSKLGAWAVLHHGGDHSAAARDLAARGYGAPLDTQWPLASAPPAWATTQGIIAPTAAPAARVPTRLPAPSDPMAVARVLEPELKWGDVYTLLNWRGSWWQWRTSHWAEIEDLALRKQLYARTEHAEFVVIGKDGPEQKRWSPTKPKIANLADALAGIVHLDRNTVVPSWLRPGHEYLGVVVSCHNGLLRLAGRVLMPHDAAYFNLVAVPFDYDPGAQEPKEWLSFLEVLWPGGGAGQVDALQEWCGYIVSGHTDMQKIFAIIGPPRSGKGTIAAVLTALIGMANVAGPTLASLATNFGLQPLLGKSLALISDARMGRSVDTSIIVERLLTISGEDVLSVDRKHLPAWEGRIPARIMLLSNELPRFSDGSGTIATRFVVAETTQSFLGREDRGLRDRLMAELPGILNWALAGLERLLERGHFTDTEVSTEAVDVMRQTASPYAPFVDEECVVGPEYEVTVDKLWQAWKLWCVRNDRERAGVKQWIGRDLKSVVPGLRIVQPRDPGTHKRYRAYQGLGLREDYPAAASAPGTRMGAPGTRMHAQDLASAHPLWPADARTGTVRHAHSETTHMEIPGSENIELQWVGARASAFQDSAAPPPGSQQTAPGYCPECAHPVPEAAWLPCDMCGRPTHARGRGAHGPTCQICLTERNAA